MNPTTYKPADRRVTVTFHEIYINDPDYLIDTSHTFAYIFFLMILHKRFPISSSSSSFFVFVFCVGVGRGRGERITGTLYNMDISRMFVA